MSKTKMVQRNFSVVDLVRNKPKLQYIVIPKYRIDVQFEVTTKGTLSVKEAPSSLLDRLEAEGRKALDKYESTIASEAERIDAKIDAMLKKSPTEETRDEAMKLLQGINKSIESALVSATAAAEKAIDVRMKTEIQSDKNLTGARVTTACRVASAALTIGASVAILVATAGQNAGSYKAIAKSLFVLGGEVYQQVKGEEKLRKDLDIAVKVYLELRATVIAQAMEKEKIFLKGIDYSHPLDALASLVQSLKDRREELIGDRSAKEVTQEVVKFAVTRAAAKLKDAEDARKFYREHTTKTRHKVDKLSRAADAMAQAMKSATTLSEGVKIGAKCMSMKHGVHDMIEKLEKREQFLDKMQEIMKENGLAMDERTALQRLKDFELSDVKEVASTLFGHAKEIAEIVEKFT